MQTQKERRQERQSLTANTKKRNKIKLEDEENNNKEKRPSQKRIW